jgi:AcrR family transcriptional regulator
MPKPVSSHGELLVRLQETFRRYGYEGASLARISFATGFGKARLYHYFPKGKEQMAADVIEDLRRWFDANIFEPLESVHPPRQRIVSMLETLSRHYDRGQCPCLPTMFALSEERTLFAEAVSQFFARWVKSLSQPLIDSGLARDIARRRAHDGVERIQGSLVLSRAFADSQPFATMAAELPNQLLAGSDRPTMWTSRAPRFPLFPVAQTTSFRSG